MGNFNSVSPNVDRTREDNPWAKDWKEGQEAPALPLPLPPTTSKSEMFNSVLFQSIDRHAEKQVKVSKVLKSTYEELAYNITKPCRSDLERARAIFTWLTAIDPATIVQGVTVKPKEGSPLEYLHRIKDRKGNKAYMYSYLCLASGVPSVLINGINKSSAYKIGSAIVKEELAAQWNAVLIDNQWRLVDTFWGSASTPDNSHNDWQLLHDTQKTDSAIVDFDHEETHMLNEFFFLPDPRMLISTHFPDDVQWQMLETPIEIPMFEKQAYLRDRFFDIDAQLIDQSLPHCVNEAKLGEIDIVFGIPAVNSQYLQFAYQIYQERGQALPDEYSLKQYVLYQKKAEVVSFNVQFPVDGRFKIDIFGKDKAQDETMELVASYIVNAIAKEGAQPLPDEPEIGWGAGTEMEEKGLETDNNDGLIETKDGCVELRFHKSNPLSVMQAMRHNAIEDWLLQHSSVIWEDGDDVVVNIRLPEPGQYAFKLYADDPNNEGELDNICNYLLRSVNPNMTPNLFPKLHKWVLGKGRYAEELNVKAESNPESHISTDDGKLRLVFNNPPDTELTLQLTSNKFEDSLLAHSIKRIEEDGQTIFELQLPDAGEYGINVYGKKINDESATIHHVHSSLVESTQNDKRVTPAEICQEQKKENKSEIETFRKLEKVPLPQGPFAGPLVGSLQRQQAQDPMDSTAVSDAKDGEDDIFKVKLPDLGKYDLDIFEKWGNGALLPVSAVIITRRPAKPGEVEVEEKPVLVKEPDDLEAQERKEIELAYAAELRKLRLAVNVLDANGIEAALKAIEAKGDVPKQLEEEMAKAYNLMTEYKKHRDALKSATDKGTIEQLEKAIKALEKASPAVRNKLNLELKRAMERLVRLRRLDKFRHAVLKLKKTTIAEIRAYATPPEPVYNVMGATFLILGETEKTAKDWTQLRALIGKTGKTNLLRRIQLYEVNTMTRETLARCKLMMKGLNLNIIRDVSVGAATFFIWVNGMMEAAEENLATS